MPYDKQHLAQTMSLSHKTASLDTFSWKRIAQTSGLVV